MGSGVMKNDSDSGVITRTTADSRARMCTSRDTIIVRKRSGVGPSRSLGIRDEASS
jgi:hypothetical protein